MMLEHLQLPRAAVAINDAVKQQLAQRGPRTPDVGGDSTTEQTGEAIAARVASTTGAVS
jgi:isocitrate/isopropylmalate dehydrogenase